MGGFKFEYVAGTEQVVQASTDTGSVRFFRVDDGRQMLMWLNEDAPYFAQAVIIDVSLAPTITVGPVTSFPFSNGYGSRAAEPVHLTGDLWLMHYYLGPTFGPDQWYVRFTVSGLSITVTSGEEDIALFWEPGDPAVPAAIFEGHTAIPFVVHYTPDDGTWTGVDANHVMIPATLNYDGTVFESKLAILDLSTNAVTLSFNETDLGFYPGESAPSAWEYGDGDSYRWASSSDGSTVYVVHVTATASSVSGVVLLDSSVNDHLPYPQFLGRALDGTLWLAPSGSDQIESHAWSVATPTVGTYRAYAFNGDAVTSYTYTNEITGLPFSGSTIPAGPGLMLHGTTSFRTNDTHVRAEGNGSVLTLGPHMTGIGSYDSAGTPTAKHVVVAQVAGTTSFGHGAPFNIYVAVVKEVATLPFAEFTFTPQGHLTGAAPKTIAFDGTNSLNGTRDSYWHPITDWYWQFDDGDVADTTVPTTSHVYLEDSIGHVGGSDWNIVPSPPLFDQGAADVYVPLLIVGNSVGLSDPVVYFFLEIDLPAIPPPQRQFPRDDGLGISTRRSWPPPTTKQYGLRRGAVSTVE